MAKNDPPATEQPAPPAAVEYDHHAGPPIILLDFGTGQPFPATPAQRELLWPETPEWTES